MRMQRSPTAVSLPLGARDTATPSSQGSDASQPGAKSYSPLAPSGHQTDDNGMSTLVGHYLQHARQKSREGAGQGMGEGELPRTYETMHLQDKHAPVETTDMPLVHTRAHPSYSRPGSFATAAYRDFLSSATHSAASSAASSAAPSRQVSRPSSGYTSQALSGQSSRNASPMSKRAEADRAAFALQHGSHIHAPQANAPYLEAHFPAAHPAQATVTTTTLTQQVSTLSFSSLALAPSDSEEEGVVSHARPQPQPRRPSHFTFCEQDIMKSFMRAAERDRARAEREERAREAQMRAEVEAEYERRKQAEREAAAREAYLAQTRYGTVGEDFTSSSDASSASPPARRRRRFPPVPHHFKFSSHDLTKSASKPSQRQNIGHWTTFPRSSTSVLPAGELVQAIRRMVREQVERERAKQLAEEEEREREQEEEEGEIRQQAAMKRTGKDQAVTARGPARGASSLQRRASLPSGYDAPRLAVTASVGIPIRTAGHVRSASFHSSGRMGKLSGDWSSDAVGLVSSLRRRSLGSESRGGFDRAAAAPTHPVRATQEARRTQTMPARPPVRSADLGPAAGSHASAPGSGSASPSRAGRSVAAARAAASAHASPARPEARRLGTSPGVRARMLAAQVAGAVAGAGVHGRKASLGGGGGESKVASAHNSPVRAATKQGEQAHQWQVAYEKSGNDACANAKVYTNPLYRDVPSSGYGQRTR